MIDVHSHVLPFVDDGSTSLEESFKMLKESEEQGITDVIFTPHYREPYVWSSEGLKVAFEKFKKEKEQAGINVNVYLGQEIFLSQDFKKDFAEDKILTLNGTPYILVEFDYCTDFDMTEIIYLLVKDGFKPIVAHFERYTFVDVLTAQEIKNLGGYIQVNAGAITDAFNFKVKNRVKTLLEEDLVDFVASDVHSVRKNSMKSAYEKVKKKYGQETADRIFIENAKEIING
jgi:protein-tyrosine phosphatase